MAQSLAYLADMVSYVVVPLVAVTALEASTAQVGLLAALGPLPVLLLGSHVGAWVDRTRSEAAVMRAAAVFRALVLASVPAVAAAGALTFAHLCLTAVLVGIASVWFNVAAQTAIPGLVERHELVAANAATRMSFSVAAVVGPSLGGLLVGTASAADALLVDSGAFALAAMLLGGVAVTRGETVVEAGDDGSVLAGLRAIRRDRRQLGLLAETVTAAFGFTAYFTLLLVFATRELGLSAGQLGTALGVGAIGAVAGSALAPRVSRRIGLGPAVIAGAFVYAGALLAVPLAPRHDPLAATVVIAAAEFVSAAAMLISEIPAASIQQAITPAGQLGRVRGVSVAANYGARTLAGVAAGGIGTVLGTGSAMPVVLAVGLLGAAWLLHGPLRAFKAIAESQA
jgi:predicted MFS family arabinose efflux permease